MCAPEAVGIQALEAANAALRQRVATLEAEVAALQQRQHLLEAIFDATTDAVFVKDRQGRYLLVNPAFAALVQRPLEAIIGRDDATMFPAEMAHWLRVDDQQVMITGATRTFEEVGTSTGSTRIYLSAKS